MSIGLAVVGAGANIWAFHRRAIQATGFDVVAVHDVATDRAKAVAAELDCVAADTLDDLLAARVRWLGR